MKKEFSSGMEQLDRFVSGFLPGDSFLVFLSAATSWSELRSSFISEALRRHIPVSYISPYASPTLEFAELSQVQQFMPKIGKSSPAALLSSMKTFLKKSRPGSYLLLEELSSWKQILKSDRNVILLFQEMQNTAVRKGSVFVTSVRRSEFGLEALAGLKDLPSICLELIIQGGENLFFPLTMKGRYSPLQASPLRLRRLTPSHRHAGHPQPAGPLDGGEPGAAAFPELFPESEYRKMFIDAGEAMMIFNLRGDYRESNRRASELLACEENELRVMNLSTLLRADERIKFLRFLIELRRRKKQVVAQFHVRPGNGRMIPVECRCSHIGNGYFLALLHDDSEHMKREADLHRKQRDSLALLEHAYQGVIVSSNSQILYVNRKILELFGFRSPEEAEAKHLKELFAPDSWRQIQKQMRAAVRAAGTNSECRCVRSDSTTFEALLSISDIVYDGKKCTLVAVTDNSMQKNLVDALTNSEKKYRAIVERSPTALSLMGDSRLIFANAACCGLFGADSQERIVGKHLSEFVDEASREKLAAILAPKGGFRKGMTRDLLGGLRADGTTFDLQMSAFPLTGSDALLVAFEDFSEQRQLQVELASRRHELAILEAISRSLNTSLDLPKILQQSLEKLMHLFSFEIGAVYLTEAKQGELQLRQSRNVPASYVAKLSTMASDEGLGGYLAKTREPLFIRTGKYPSYLPHRTFFKELGWRSLQLLPLVAQDAFSGMILLATKNERKSAEHSESLLKAVTAEIATAVANATAFTGIREAAESQTRLIESLSTVLYLAAPGGQMQYVSPGIEALSGHAPKDFFREASLWLRLVHPDDKKYLLERTTHLNELQGPTVIEYQIAPRGKASYRFVRDECSPIRDAEGNVILIQGSLTDVTDEKSRLESALNTYRQSADVISSIHDGLAVYDRNLKCLQWNKGMERLTGHTSEEMVGHPPSAAFPHIEQHRITLLIESAMGGENVQADDIRYYVPGTNKIGYLWGRFSPLLTGDGKVYGTIAILTDFSERKQVEMEMHDSEQVLRNVIDTMGDILLIADLKGNVLEVNKSFLRVLGYSRSETIGHEFPYPWVLEEEMGRFVLWIAELRERNWLHDFDMTWRSKDGRLIPMSLSTTLLRNSMGEPIATLNIARDITERKRLTQDLQSRTRQIEMINRIISKANETMDFDEIFHSIAGEINEVILSDLINIGILDDDETSLTVYPLKGAQALHKGDTIPIDRTLSRYAIASGKPIVVPDLSAEDRYRSLSSFSRGLRSQISFPIILKGKAFGALNIGSRKPNFYSEADAEVLQPIAQQIGTIIDRVQLFRQVTEDSAYIHNLLDSINSIVYTVDTQYRLREVNKAWHEFMQDSGFPGIRNYHGMNLFDVLPSESLKTTFRNVVDDIVSGSVRAFSQEFIHSTITGDRIYQLTVNPMTIDRKITGLVFTHADITALKKTEEQLKRSNEQLLALNKISTLISTSLDLTEIMETTIPLLKKETRADAVLVYLIDDANQDLVLTKQIGFGEIDFGHLQRLSKGSSATGMVVQSKEPLYINEKAFIDERIIGPNRDVLRKLNLHAMAVIPLASKDKVWGALDIFYRTPYEFTMQEQQMLSLVGHQFGSAIENAQLYRELRSQIDRLTVLYQISQHLTSTLELDQIFSAVHENIQHVVPYEKFTIALYDAWTKSTTTVFDVSTSGGRKLIDAEKGETKSLQPGSAEAMVVSTKKSYRDPDHSSMYVPMLSKQTIIGIMSARGNREAPYTETHLRLLESVGNLTALAVEKAKLYEETVKISLEIQRRNKELDDFTYVVSHDLKEPLISIEGFSRILQMDYRDLVQGEGKDYLDSIVGATTRMKGLIDDLLMLSRVSRPSEAFKAVPLSAVVADIRTDMEFTVRQKGVRFVIPADLPTVHGNETQLKILFRNLIGNAVKFNNRVDPLVEIGFRNAENNCYLLHVKDNGIGIDKEFHEKVFVIFQRLHRREEYEGTGAGLAIVKKIVEIHKGKIWIESEVGKGSTFFFTIPRGNIQEGS